MRPRLARRELIAVAVVAAGLVAAGASFAPIVRAEVARQASRRHLEVRVGAVRPGWFNVHLLSVEVRPQGVSSLSLRAADVRIGLSVLFRPTSLVVTAAALDLTGSAQSLRDDWQAWRGAPSEATTSGARPIKVVVSHGAVHWTGDDSAGANLRGVELTHDDSGTRILIEDGQVRSGEASLELGRASVELDPAKAIARARLESLTLGWTLGLHAGSLERAGGGAVSPPPPSSPPSPPAVTVARAAHARPARGAAPTASAPGAPLLPLPDLHMARAAAGAAASLLAQRIRPGADIGVSSLTWKVTQDQAHVALTFGPGPLSVTRTPAQFEVLYSTSLQGNGTPLGLRVVVPTDGGDVVTTVEGGPVSLALLGVQEGALGLMDVGSATVDGKARVALAGDGSTLTFDADAMARGVALNHPKLASEAVRGIDVSMRARGALSADGDLRLDDFAAALGALHLSGSGTLAQKPDHVAASLRFEVQPTACQSLLDSMPSGLLPALQGTRIAGTFGARGHFAFDTRSLDELQLDYDIQDRCRLTQVPAALDREHFTRPFSHRVYLPDGTTTDEVTGPGTPDWTTLDEISPYMQTAVLTTEDGAFPKHHGYNHAAIRQSVIANLKARRFVRGASTITMQLAKNLFLSREKTLSRKLEEVIFTDYLEQTFSKDELMELYLNVIEFGPSVYGITQAAEYYFGRAPAELDLAECLFLSSLLPAPLRYSAMRDGEQPPDGWMRTIHSLMEVERKRGLITDAELTDGQAEQVLFWHGGPHPSPRAAARTHAPVVSGDTDIPDPFETAAPDAP